MLIAVYVDLAYNHYRFSQYVFKDPQTGSPVPVSMLQIFQLFMIEERAVAGLAIFVVLVAFVTVIFTFFHLLPLTLEGLTSNESGKLSDVKEYFRNGGPAVSYERRGQVLVAKKFNDIENMYDSGSKIENLKQFLFPPKLKGVNKGKPA